jgi:hypothetical protein
MYNLPFQIIKSLYKNTSVQIDTGREILDKMYINQGVRQGCNLSPTVFTDYIDHFPRNWKHKVDAAIMVKRNLYFNTLLFADDQVIKQDSADKLQKSHYLLTLCRSYLKPYCMGRKTVFFQRAFNLHTKARAL